MTITVTLSIYSDYTRLFERGIERKFIIVVKIEFSSSLSLSYVSSNILISFENEFSSGHNCS